MFSKNIFATRVKQLRTLNNISQSDLAEALGITKSAISDIERERRTTTIDKLYEIASFFNVSSDYLLGLSDDPQPRDTAIRH